MKNCIPFIIIVVLMAGIFAFNYNVMNTIEYELLDSAIELRTKVQEQENCINEYNDFVKKFEDSEVKINMIINHSIYNDIMKCVTEIGNNIEYDDKQALLNNVDKLVFYLEDIMANEKAEINNIL